MKTVITYHFRTFYTYDTNSGISGEITLKTNLAFVPLKVLCNHGKEGGVLEVSIGMPLNTQHFRRLKKNFLKVPGTLNYKKRF